jgi:hypothetical protein
MMIVLFFQMVRQNLNFELTTFAASAMSKEKNRQINSKGNWYIIRI